MSRNTTEYKSKICAKGVFRSARHENILKFYWEKGILVVLEEFPAIFTMVVSFGGVYERT